MTSQIENAGGRFVDKVTVMRHVENGAGIAVQRVFQNLLGGDV